MRIIVEIKTSTGYCTVFNVDFDEEPDWNHLKQLLAELWKAERLIEKPIKGEVENDGKAEVGKNKD